MNIFISAGEKSGELHASDLVRELTHLGKNFNFKITGLGGDLMKKEGVELLYHINELTTSGITGVIKKYKYFRRVLRDCIEYVRSQKPKVIILIDFPGFNLKFAEDVRKFYDRKIIYYVSPQVWAWHKSRVYKIKKYINKMLVVFPFEKDFYEEYGVKAQYVGHPLVKRIKEFMDEKPSLPPFRKGGMLSAQSGKGEIPSTQPRKEEKERIITILPGSRNEEIGNHMPILIEAARRLRDELSAEIYFHMSDSIHKKKFDRYNEKLKDFHLTGENVYRLIMNSDVVLTKAGTSTIECALIGTPFLIFYRTNPVNYRIIKPMVDVKNMGMVNILAGKTIVKEFIQNDFTASKLAGETRKILENTEYREQVKANMQKLWEILGDENASLNAAKAVLSYL